jgi:hypothetical protein
MEERMRQSLSLAHTHRQTHHQYTNTHTHTHKVVERDNGEQRKSSRAVTMDCCGVALCVQCTPPRTVLHCIQAVGCMYECRGQRGEQSGAARLNDALARFFLQKSYLTSPVGGLLPKSLLCKCSLGQAVERYTW